ncbi:hypothetical protein D3C86_1435520 [compost metagenome]
MSVEMELSNSLSSKKEIVSSPFFNTFHNSAMVSAPGNLPAIPIMAIGCAVSTDVVYFLFIL